MRNGTFWLVATLVGLAFVVADAGVLSRTSTIYFAAYVVLQYIVLSTAWNILGGYTGYTNFGTGAFFAMGAYSSVVLHKLFLRAAAGDDPGRRHRLGHRRARHRAI